MNAPDLKKLITAFLVFAIAASSIAFLFSARDFTYSSESDTARTPDIEVQGISIGENAFVEPLPAVPPSIVAETDDGTALVLTPPDPSNLTQNLIHTLAKEVIAANAHALEDPEGAIIPPTASELNRLIEEKLATFSLGELAPNIRIRDLVILGTHKPGDVDRYVLETTKAMRAVTESDRFRLLLQNAPSVVGARDARRIFGDAVRTLTATPVPIELAKLHRSIVMLFAVQEKLFDVVQNYRADPAKTLVLAQQNPADLIGPALKNFEDEFSKINFVRETSRKKSLDGLATIFAKLLGVREAKAFIGVPTTVTLIEDPSFLAYMGQDATVQATKLGQTFFEWARKVGKEILKNQIVRTLVQQVITWIKGGGRPQFITDWRGFLNDSFRQAAGTVIENSVPQLCSSIGPLARLALSPLPDLQPRVGCTLDKIGVNLEQFYSRFGDGSWAAYGASLNSGGNFFTSVIQIRDFAVLEGSKAKESRKSEGEADGGFLSTKICKDGSRPRGAVGPTGPQLPCEDGSTPKTTSPGGVAGGLTKKAVADSPIDNIVNAEDMEALVAAFVDTFTNRFLQSGVEGITGVFNTDEPETGTTSSGASCSAFPVGSAAYNSCIGVGNASGQSVSGQPPPPPGGIPNFNFRQSPACTSTATPRCSEFTDPTDQEVCIQACYP